MKNDALRTNYIHANEYNILSKFHMKMNIFIEVLTHLTGVLDNTPYRNVGSYEIVMEHFIQPLFKKWWGTVLSKPSKRVGSSTCPQPPPIPTPVP